MSGQVTVKKNKKKQEHSFLHELNFLIVEMFVHQAALLPVACLYERQEVKNQI